MPTNTLRRKELSHLLPEGTVATRLWLLENQLSRHSIDNLVKSGELHSVVPGVYTRRGAKPTWQGVVYFLQSRRALDLTIGGLSALDLQGLSHYLAMGPNKTIHLYGTIGPPSWIKTVVPNVSFEWHNEWELLGGRKYKSSDKEPGADPLQKFTRRQDWKEGQSGLLISAPERAFLEILMDVPQKISFEHADQLMQGLTSLSPRHLQVLLEQCENIKVRRLFFWLADRHKYTWLEKLQVEKINMGSGKRMLMKGGKLDKKYNITVPEFI